MLWPGVAEGAVAGKAHFVRAGVFKDVDVALFTHVGNDLGVTWGPVVLAGDRVGLSSGSRVTARTLPAPRGAEERTRRGDADGAGLGIPSRAHGAGPALALRDQGRRRPAERRAQHGIDLVSTSAKRDYEHMQDMFEMRASAWREVRR